MTKPLPDFFPPDLAARIARSRRLFQGFRMSLPVGEAELGTTPPAGAGSGESGDSGEGPIGTKPIADMTADEQAAYWKAYARRHESEAKALAAQKAKWVADQAELDRLKTQSMSDQEKLVAQARAEERAKVSSEYGARLVAAEVKFLLAGTGRKATDVSAITAALDPTKFLTEAGEVDTDKVKKFVNGIAPVQDPDMGQGNRGAARPGKGVSAGADLFDQRRGGKKK